MLSDDASTILRYAVNTGRYNSHRHRYHRPQQHQSLEMPSADATTIIGDAFGTAETLGDPYLRQVLLPRIPNYREIKAQRTQQHPFTQVGQDALSAKLQWTVRTPTTLGGTPPEYYISILAPTEYVASMYDVISTRKPARTLVSCFR